MLAQCGLSSASHPTLLTELLGLRRRAAEAHAQHDHVHELVLLKVAGLLERRLPAPPQGATSSSTPLPLGCTPQRPLSPRKCDTEAPLPPLAPRGVPAAEACPPERRPSLIRRPSCGSMGMLSPSATGVVAAPEPTAKTAADTVPACNAVMLRSVSSRSLSAIGGGGEVGCAVLAAAEDADMDPSDIPALVQVLVMAVI